MPISKLPWSADSYTKLDDGDLDPSPPTPERRLRVAAALLTLIRDGNMTGRPTAINAEAVRAILVMSDAAWARDIGDFRGQIEVYDGEDPMRRYEAVVRASQG